MYIEWIAETSKIQLSQKSATMYDISSGVLTFQFGSWTQNVQVQVKSDFPDEKIGLPKHWKDVYTIPDTLPYVLKRDNTTLKLGPVIALIVFSDLKDMTILEMNKYRAYFSDYPNIQGLVYLCGWNTIDTRKKQIKGFYFDPNVNGSSNHWKSGTFPYPGAAYNRQNLPKNVFDDLQTTMGDCIFNSFSPGSFNKWELWKRLSPIESLRSHLPATMLLTDITVLENMLNQYDSIYLKPTGGTLSRGIRKVEKSPAGYIVTYPSFRNPAGSQKLIEHPKSIQKWFHKLQNKEYLAQQAITMKRYQNRPIDFRIIMQKDGKGKWDCSGVFGKFGKSGGIITNFSRSGYIRSGLKTFRQAFGMNNKKAQNKVEEIKKIAFEICRVFDQYGNYGDLGIDLMVDHDGKVWILEVNTKDTYHRFPLHINNKKLYRKIVTAPFRYGKFLAGF
ncbi:YheC/YheD family protein [Neobacillus mesonae]|uniref:YheC/YheD family endospore coat-associated protein n=1 Tax=Neobacillus mesonae TaxID=1193713 RepID=UPI00203F4756|nr:YheC/YheD family protein [Neobacillus mesonae]MCM3570955.1 YheC/YheD family protein [Neobacillus mesonae]